MRCNVALSSYSHAARLLHALTYTLSHLAGFLLVHVVHVSSTVPGGGNGVQQYDAPSSRKLHHTRESKQASASSCYHVCGAAFTQISAAQ